MATKQTQVENSELLLSTAEECSGEVDNVRDDLDEIQNSIDGGEIKSAIEQLDGAIGDLVAIRDFLQAYKA